ncbi:MAG: NAD(P)-dependent alcohol dehydrogenase [Leucobacter sp.]
MSTTTSSPLPAEMRANVLMEPKRLEMQSRPVPAPGPGEVLIKVGSVGICGSDTQFYETGQLAHFVVDSPIVLGHELGGTIVAVGENVSESRVGTRVAVEPQRINFEGEIARAGLYNLEEGAAVFGAPPMDGAFQEYVLSPAYFAHPIPDTVSDDQAALLEPVSVAIASVRKANITAGNRVLIAGAGPIGVLLTQVALAYGATEVYISDIDPYRRERALKFGATAALDPVTQDIAALGLGVDAFIDASGAPAAVASGIANVKVAGRAVLVGHGPNEMMLPVTDIMDREIILTGIFRYRNTWPTAIALLAAGRLQLDDFVTSRFPLSDVEGAFAASVKPESLKVLVRSNE